MADSNAKSVGSFEGIPRLSNEVGADLASGDRREYIRKVLKSLTGREPTEEELDAEGSDDATPKFSGPKAEKSTAPLRVAAEFNPNSRLIAALLSMLGARKTEFGE